MEAINRAFEGAALFQDLMRKLEHDQRKFRDVVAARPDADEIATIGGDRFTNENRKDRRARERRERKAAMRAKA